MADTEYKLAYDGPQIDTAIGRALPGGGVDAALESKAEIEFLDNTDFTNPVAQAGIGGNHGSVVFALDRWQLISGTVSGSANGLTLNGTIRQVREYSIGFPVVPSIEMYSGTATITYDNSTKYCDIVSSGGVIKRPHLGLAAITDWSKVPYQKREKALQECQRYYFKFNLRIPLFAKDAWNFYAQSQLFPTTMRTVPAIIVYSLANGTANALSTNSGTEFSDFTNFTISASVDGFNFDSSGVLVAGNYYAARGYEAIADLEGT